MLKIILVIIYLYYAKIIAEYRNCKNCKYFIPFKRNQLHDFGFCKIFPLTVKEEDNSIFLYELTMIGRNNESLCGKSGFYYTEKTNNNYTTSKTDNESSIQQLMADYSLFLRKPNNENKVSIHIDVNDDINKNTKKMIHEYNIFLRQNQIM
jgi:hypothetical protein